MTIESALKEVAPILQGRIPQFTHPSFQEILAARQFAGEINSERLSVKDAYLNLWSKPAKSREVVKDFRTIRSEWRQVLKHLSPMLSKKAANVLIRTISDSYFLCERRINFSSTGKFYSDVLEDFSLCAEVIGDNPSLQSDRRARQIVDVLMGVVYKCGKSEGTTEIVQGKRALRAKDALRKTKSSYVATKLAEYISFVGHTSMYDYDYSSQISLLKTGAFGVLDNLLKEGCKVDESVLIEKIGSRKEINRNDLFLLLDYGGFKSFRHAANVLSREHYSLNCKTEYVFWDMLKSIKKRGFEPKLINLFNKVVKKIDDDDFEAIVSYNKALSSFAEKFKELSGKELYDHLGEKGIQFFNSEVYKPK